MACHEVQVGPDSLVVRALHYTTNQRIIRAVVAPRQHSINLRLAVTCRLRCNSRCIIFTRSFGYCWKFENVWRLARRVFLLWVDLVTSLSPGPSGDALFYTVPLCINRMMCHVRMIRKGLDPHSNKGYFAPSVRCNARTSIEFHFIHLSPYIGKKLL